jgi:hypothetical protein
MVPGARKASTGFINTVMMKNTAYFADHPPTATGVSRPRPENTFTATAQINASIAAPPISVWAVNTAPTANTKNKGKISALKAKLVSQF